METPQRTAEKKYVPREKKYVLRCHLHLYRAIPEAAYPWAFQLKEIMNLLLA